MVLSNKSLKISRLEEAISPSITILKKFGFPGAHL